MGNYTSTWTQPRYLPGPCPASPSPSQYLDIAGEQSEVLTSTDEECPEMREVKLRELPSEVWADVIAFLSFQEKVKLLP